LKALKGIVVMSGELEQMADSLYDNMVPVLWENAGCQSTKPLSGWTSDLKKRVAFIASWVDDGPPHVFWISGFFMQ
jgi:dynein heavy chain